MGLFLLETGHPKLFKYNLQGFSKIKSQLSKIKSQLSEIKSQLSKIKSRFSLNLEQEFWKDYLANNHKLDTTE